MVRQSRAGRLYQIGQTWHRMEQMWCVEGGDDRHWQRDTANTHTEPYNMTINKLWMKSINFLTYRIVVGF